MKKIYHSSIISLVMVLMESQEDIDAATALLMTRDMTLEKRAEAATYDGIPTAPQGELETKLDEIYGQQ